MHAKSPFLVTLVPMLVVSLCAAEPSAVDCLNAHENSFTFANAHKLRAERDLLLQCAAQSCPKMIQKECQRRVDELNEEIATISFTVKDNAGHEVRVEKLWMENELLAENYKEMELEVDPGDHHFRFEVAETIKFEREFHIEASQKGIHVLVSFVAPAEPRSQPLPVLPSPLPMAAIEPRSLSTPLECSDRSPRLNPQRIAALAIWGVGVVGLSVGTYYAFKAVSQRSDAREVCPDGHVCRTFEGVQRWETAWHTANRATVGFVIGGIALTGGAALWFTTTPGTDGATKRGIGVNGVNVAGRW